MKFFRKLSGRLVRTLVASPWRCIKCGVRSSGPTSGIHCKMGGSHEWEYIG